ncbi:HipA domain-containing protein [Halopseudomonas aestusnigri]|jgi:serine/threonine-protein kinase HipA|uniref:type II toxin-antitoxin system HipA family toxin n=1 Tax=Halopseudomonas TaxID=2901189 RepID=UPI0025579024|nr:HipA domain-containing protein [Halopseudomonas aestusnigri]MDL2201005.1 HipA domain-containing protein [Halopseudomonas aestusnigri]MED5493762.1 HipA domain-containing protein [Pseudomonadota bacterium]
MTPIEVCADWEGLGGPQRLGWLHAWNKGAIEKFEYEHDPEALTNPLLSLVQIDPSILPYEGSQYPPNGRDMFGVFGDSCPDRWGRLLMKRRLERDIRDGLAPKGSILRESDYLLGVHDQYRVGALRYRPHGEGAFLDNTDNVAAPPFVAITELERASQALERDPNNTSRDGRDWLRMLIAPGGSLGGARPKASVVDDAGHLWIAKFPSVRDEYDVGGWEMVVNALAKSCGINVAQGAAQRYASPFHCFRVKRFDRTEHGGRLHFASAMTLTGHIDGEDASTGVSYLELAEVLIRAGSEPKRDLQELWTRIVFSILVSNTDDHLRNHGFILSPSRGWCLSEAYDINPVPTGDSLKLNITEADNALDLELAREVAGLFRLPLSTADDIIGDCKLVVGQWRTIAKAVGLPPREQDYMAPAFALSGS